MTARDTIARLRFAAGKLSLSEMVEVSKADLRELLTYRLIPPGQLDSKSLEAAAKVCDARAVAPDPDEIDPYDDYDMGARSEARTLAAAIRALDQKEGG